MSDFITIGTPESVDLAFEPVGMGSRFLASIIDLLIQWGVVFLLLLLIFPARMVDRVAGNLAGNITVSILFLLMTLLLSFYKLLFEGIWNGQTIGKRIVGIRVVRENGLPVSFLQVLIRNLLRVIDFLPGWYVIGALTVLFTQKHQRLGDLAAGTVVVRDRKAVIPVAPALNRPPTCDLDLLREHVGRLSEADLAPARSFLMRRLNLVPENRVSLGQQIAAALGGKMGWQQPVYYPEAFLEEIFHVRSQV